VYYDALRFDPRLNTVDPGRLLLGVPPSTSRNPVRQALAALASRIIDVREAALTSAPFKTRTGMSLGVIPLGRADGIASVVTGHVFIRETRAPIVATWVEHTSVDVTRVPDVTPGDELIIFGRQRRVEIAFAKVLSAHPAFKLVDVSTVIAASVARVAVTT
jgi:alanine racemase